jgi:hypothetical protein
VTAELVYDGRSVRIFAPHNRDFVTALKATIPFPFRAWSSGERAWTVSLAFDADVRWLCDRYFGTFRVVHCREAGDAVAKDGHLMDVGTPHGSMKNWDQERTA